MEFEEEDDSGQKIIDLYGGVENMRNFRVLSACEANAINLAKLAEEICQPNPSQLMQRLRVEAYAKIEHLEEGCSDPNHETYQTYYREV